MTGERYTTVLHLSCLYAVLWGLFILWPLTENFASSAGLYAPMLQIVPYEEFWGGLYVLSGISAYVLGRKWPWAGSFVMTGMFVAIAVLFFLGDVQRPGWALIGTLGVFNFLQGRAKWKVG